MNVRLEIEAIAAGWAADRRDESVIAPMAGHLEEMERAIARDDVKSYLRNNYAFHFAIYRAAGSENLLGIIENLWLQISPYFSKLYGSYEIANRHHRVLFHALEARDAAAAQDALRNDINAAYETLSRQVT